VGILAIGLAPFWLSELIRPGAELISNKLTGMQMLFHN
jgi:hypothetical protein